MTGYNFIPTNGAKTAAYNFSRNKTKQKQKQNKNNK